jgi:hypothetical protein
VSASIVVSAIAASLSHAQVPVYTFPGTAEAQQQGTVVVLAGDLDHDGTEDIAIGNPIACSEGIPCGTVEIRSGRTGAIVRTLTGEAGDLFGSALCGAGDYDSDGWDDLLVGAPGHFGGHGWAGVLSGQTGAVLFWSMGMASGDEFGKAVALVGNADFVAGADFAVSSPSESTDGFVHNGRVRVFSGGTGDLVYAFSGTWTDASNQGFGLSLAGGLDWNDDGLDDVLVGSPYFGYSGNPSCGMAQVLCSSPTPFIGKACHGPAYDRFGWSVAVIGDQNGDGKSEFAVGSPWSDANGTDSGKVDVFGPHSPSGPILTVAGMQGSNFGFSVAGMPDVDADGKPDLVVGAPQYFLFSVGRLGAIQVYSAVDGDLIHTAFGKQVEGMFGSSVTGVGDLNDDGFGDFAAGEPYYDGIATNSGLVRVFLGHTALPTTFCTGKTNSLGCEPSIWYSGAPSTTVADNFHVLASEVRNKSAGMLIWSQAAASKPFFGGTLCLGGTIVRTSVQNSGGSASGADCSGTYDFHFSQAYLAQAGLSAGTTVYSQYWMRDSGFPPPDTVALTRGLSFVVLP